jgi:hypothetical protein
VTGSSPDYVIAIFNLPNPSTLAMALGFTQPLTKLSEDPSWGKGRQAHKAGNITAILEPVV